MNILLTFLLFAVYGIWEDLTPVCADDLPTILGFFKNDPKSRSVNIFLQRLDFDPNRITDLFDPPKLRPALACVRITARFETEKVVSI